MRAASKRPCAFVDGTRVAVPTSHIATTTASYDSVFASNTYITKTHSAIDRVLAFKVGQAEFRVISSTRAAVHALNIVVPLFPAIRRDATFTCIQTNVLAYTLAADIYSSRVVRPGFPVAVGILLPSSALRTFLITLTAFKPCLLLLRETQCHPLARVDVAYSLPTLGIDSAILIDVATILVW